MSVCVCVFNHRAHISEPIWTEVSAYVIQTLRSNLASSGSDPIGENMSSDQKLKGDAVFTKIIEKIHGGKNDFFDTNVRSYSDF